MSKAVAYYRVSRERQGVSGLGLEAQEAAVQEFVNKNGFMVIEHFTEIESGKNDRRPLLKKALNFCRKENATLLIAKLDRLSRKVSFISQLMESDVRFIDVDDPHAEDFIRHIKAAFAEHERKLISKRTKAALQAAKARGVELGKHGRYVLSKLNRLQAEQFAASMQPIFQSLRAQGITTIRAITDELNRLNIPTATKVGRRWHISTVHQTMQRLKNAS